MGRRQCRHGRGSERRVIPLTPLVERYRGLQSKSEAERLQEAEYFAQAPAELARELEDSALAFASYSNLEEPFHPTARTEGEAPNRVEATHHFALALKQQGRVHPRDGSAERLSAGDWEPKELAAEQLAFDYVEREVTVTRTTRAEWSDGSAGRRRFSLDLLLSAIDGRVPIATEVKIGGDRALPLFQVAPLTAIADTEERLPGTSPGTRGRS